MKKIGFLALAFLLITNISFSQDSLKSITLSDIYKKGTFRSKPVRGIRSLPNGKQYTMIVNGSLVVFDYKTGDSVSTLINAKDLIIVGQEKPIRLSSYEMSNDENKFLIPTETEDIYRHSSISAFYVYNRSDNSLTPLSENKQRLADFSPDGQQVAFVRDNNIFVKNLSTGNEIQITSDGKINHIINGTCDWVYEEEFGFTKAFFWSPDGKKIAFYRFDESRVKEYTLTFYGDLYPELYTYKYPKAGEENSIVNIYVYNLETGKTTKMDVGNVTDQYIPRIKWSNDPKLLAIQRLNRLQNHLDILLADGETGESTIIYSEDNPYYIDITDNLTFMNDNSGFLFTSEADGFNHIYLYNMEGKIENQLTKGNWDVTEVYGFDAKKKLVYFQSAETSTINRGIYSVDLKGKIKKLSTKEGENEADFSDDFSFYINTWSDANTPPYITLNQADGKEVRVLENNAALVA
ncbi:MAG TPA: DPP IV N-terminal domain-containing protein, partial [Bacteroidales bacterium]